MKVGIYVNNWGAEEAHVALLEALADYCGRLEAVDAVQLGTLKPEASKIKAFYQWMADNGLGGAVLATPKPRLLKEALKASWEERETPIPPVEVIDINNLYQFTGERELEKAEILVRAAARRVAHLEPVEKQRIKVEQSALVIGGGIIGMEVATRIADQGFQVHLVEREPFLGGKTPQLGTCFPSMDCGNCIAPFNGELHRRCMYRSPVTKNPRIKVHTLSEVKKLAGVIGNFRVIIEKKPRYIDEEKCIGCGRCMELCKGEAPNEFDLGLSKRKAVYIPSNQSLPRVPYLDLEHCENPEELAENCPVGAIDLSMQTKTETLKVGTVVLATGFDMFNPEGMYLYGENPNVLTQLELARLLDMSGPTGGQLNKPGDGAQPQSVVMVQCVGSRDVRVHEYCSRICCGIAVKHALDIKKRWPDIEVTILHKDLRLNGKDYENLYYEAVERGVRFIRGEAQSAEAQGPNIVFHYLDEDGSEVELSTDLLVLSNGMEPSKGTRQLALSLGLDLNTDGFINERNPKLSPVETNLPGVYICGACQGPMDIQHSLNQALYATGKALNVLRNQELEVELTKAVVDEDVCVGCGACASACPFDAITWSNFGLPVVNVEACTGCGICSATCPVSAMQLRLFRDEQILPAIEGLLKPSKWLKESEEPVVVAFACEGAAGYAAELASQLGMHLPHNLRLLKVPCTGRIDALHLLKAFQMGAEGVAIFACPESQCQYIDGSKKAEERVTYLRKALDVLGIGGQRLGIYHVNSCEPDKLLQLSQSFVGRIQTITMDKRTME